MAPTARLLCLRFPHLGLLAAHRRHPELREEPVIVVDGPPLHSRVVAASAAVLAAGVRPGQLLRQARQLFPTAAVVVLDAEAVCQLRSAVLASLGSVVPRVEVGDEEAWADLGGRHLRYPDEESWAVAAARAVAATLGEPLRGGLASSRFVAFLAAREGPPNRVRRIPRGEEATFLAPLPVTVLPAAPDLLARLAALGIDRLGHLAALSAADLVAQFGPEGRELHRLARGEDGADLQPTGSPPALGERLVLDGLLGDLEALQAGVRHLCERLGEALQRRGLAAARLTLTLEGDDGREATATRVPPAPLGSPQEVWPAALGLLRAIPLPGPIGAVRLEATATVRAEGRQTDLWQRDPAATGDLARALTRLGDRYGEAALLRPRLALDPGDLPERRIAWVPVVEGVTVPVPLPVPQR